VHHHLPSFELLVNNRIGGETRLSSVIKKSVKLKGQTFVHNSLLNPTSHHVFTILFPDKLSNF
jgi:hypothetical protein